MGTDKVSATLGILSFTGGLVSLIPHPITIAAGRLVGATTAVGSVAYASYQISKEEKVSFDNASNIALAAGDIAILSLEHKFPISAALISRLLKNYSFLIQ